MSQTPRWLGWRAGPFTASRSESSSDRLRKWSGDAGSFDVVASAQAWHWIDPERGSAIARQALRLGGVLAIWWNQAEDWEGPVRDAIDNAYHRHAPDLARSVVNRPVHALDPESLALDGFERPQKHNYVWTEAYDAASYAELLQTHSDHRMLPPEQLAALLQAVAAVIERAGGELIYPYRTDLLTLRRTDPF
jgi:SAM-dependent methyltransferase